MHTRPEPAPAASAEGWAASRRGRRELLAVALFGLVSVAVPLFCTELYPFSRAPMFADAPECYCNYAVYDQEGRPLPALDFGLHRNYWGNPPGAGVGFEPPPSADRFGEVPPRAEVTALVQKHLARTALAHVDVTREVVGPRGDGVVGTVRAECWRVPNPRFASGVLP
jgi:hypothetical protein